MINNLAQDVQNIRENKNIVECGKVVLLGNNATTNIRWWSIQVFYTDESGPKTGIKERRINKIGKVKKVITFPNINQALWNTNKLTTPENFEVNWGEGCANMTCFNI